MNKKVSEKKVVEKKVKKIGFNKRGVCPTECPKCKEKLTEESKIVNTIRTDNKGNKTIYYKYYCRLCTPKKVLTPNKTTKLCKFCLVDKKLDRMTIDKVYTSPATHKTKIYYKNICKDCWNSNQNLKNKKKSESK